MIDEVGAIYEGRWSGAGAQQWPSEDEDSRAVVAGHVYGCNEGSCGIALLGDFDEQPPTSAAISALVELLAHLSARHGFAAVGLGIPVMTHLHLRPVTCPGRELFGQLLDPRRGRLPRAVHMSDEALVALGPGADGAVVATIKMPDSTHSVTFASPTTRLAPGNDASLPLTLLPAMRCATALASWDPSPPGCSPRHRKFKTSSRAGVVTAQGLLSGTWMSRQKMMSSWATLGLAVSAAGSPVASTLGTRS